MDSPPDVTDAPVEQGERKRCKEHRTVPESADSSSSSSSESATDTEMGSVDACTILPENPEAQRRRRGGPVTPDFQIVAPNAENWYSGALLLIGWITNRHWWRDKGKHGRFCTGHSSVSCTKFSCAEDGTFFTDGACGRSSQSFHASSDLLASCSSEWEERKKSRSDRGSPWKSQDIFGPRVSETVHDCP